ncbi:MAG: hypothetical protein HC869_10435 [Rhodospirillales bacterium]|nr:hypothetical protein [Rhodospirillales bacterium]
MNIEQPPPEIMKEFLAAWDRIAAKEAASNPVFKEAWESQKAYASVVVPGKRTYFPNYAVAAEHYWPTKK